MSLLQAYLRNPRTRRTLSRKPGENGFSLIELVVVIAVLAVLIVIALPNFQGVTDDAAASAGKKFLVDAFTECNINRTRAIAGAEITIPTINGGTFSPDDTVTCPDEEDDATLEFDPALDTIPVFEIDLYTGAKTCTLGDAEEGSYNCNGGKW